MIIIQMKKISAEIIQINLDYNDKNTFCCILNKPHHKIVYIFVESKEHKIILLHTEMGKHECGK